MSIAEQMDFTTSIDKVILTNLTAFAEYYIVTLSAETRKGKAERKRHNNVLLPFGAKKGNDNVPVADPETHPGLVMAFETSAAGASDREASRALPDAGYRTTGNRGRNPFAKDTVRPMLQNRFSLGELPDSNDGWMPGKHTVMIDAAHFDAAIAARFRNLRRRRSTPTPTACRGRFPALPRAPAARR